MLDDKKFDISCLNGKDINEVISLAEELSKKDKNNKMIAHKIYSSLIGQVPNIYNHPYASTRGFLRQKIWNLEKNFGWNSNFFSQSGQDQFINKYFFKNIKNGFFLEIGAYDGLEGSNCYYFEKNMNWKGIAIEPSLVQFKKLVNNRTCKCLNDAITKEKKTVEFIEVVQGLMQISGVNNEYYKDTLDIINNDTNTNIKKRTIITSTFQEVAGCNKLIDYLSLDIEGGELEVLESIDFNYYHIKVISVENNFPEKTNFNFFLLKKNFVYFDRIGRDEIYYNKRYFDI